MLCLTAARSGQYDEAISPWNNTSRSPPPGSLPRVSQRPLCCASYLGMLLPCEPSGSVVLLPPTSTGGIDPLRGGLGFALPAVGHYWDLHMRAGSENGVQARWGVQVWDCKDVPLEEGLVE